MILSALSSIVAVLLNCGGSTPPVEDNSADYHQREMDDALHGLGRFKNATPEERGTHFINHLKLRDR